MAAFLSSIVLGAVVLVFNSVSQGAHDAGLRADLQTQTREVVTDLSIELRVVVPVWPGAAAVESLTGSTLVFYTDRYDFAGPERIAYQRTSCVGGTAPCGCAATPRCRRRARTGPTRPCRSTM